MQLRGEAYSQIRSVREFQARLHLQPVQLGVPLQQANELAGHRAALESLDPPATTYDYTDRCAGKRNIWNGTPARSRAFAVCDTAVENESSSRES
jgi:hypothetical protein